MKNLTLALIALVAVSCAHRQKVLDTAAISMTHDSLKPGTELMTKGPVTAEFCTDAMNDKGQIGLMDEAVKKAQATAQIDYIMNATFWSTAGGCMVVEGEGANVVASKVVETKLPKRLKK
jgi:Na+/H+ antiporter NhaD/arsenite permease-like protein